MQSGAKAHRPQLQPLPGWLARQQGRKWPECPQLNLPSAAGMRSGIEQHDEYTAPDKPKPTFQPIQRGEGNLAKTFCLVCLVEAQVVGNPFGFPFCGFSTEPRNQNARG